MSFSVNHCIAERSTNAAMAIELLHDDGDYTQRDKTSDPICTNLFNWMTTTVLLLFSLFILRIYLEMLLLLFIVELHSNEKYCESSECVFLYVAINFIKFSSFSLQKHNNWIVPMLEFQKQRY